MAYLHVAKITSLIPKPRMNDDLLIINERSSTADLKRKHDFVYMMTKKLQKTQRDITMELTRRVEIYDDEDSSYESPDEIEKVTRPMQTIVSQPHSPLPVDERLWLFFL